MAGTLGATQARRANECSRMAWTLQSGFPQSTSPVSATFLSPSRYNELSGAIQTPMHSTSSRRSVFPPSQTLLPALLVAVLFAAAPGVRAQFGAPPTTQVHDPAALKPPAGARVAIVEFEDMECPDCANANPLL